MNALEFCIRRPVFATVLSLLVVLIGAISYVRLPLREYPNIDAPVVSVSTRYPGASALIMESQVTKPLEDSLSGLEGIDYITSVSRAESSQISVRFLLSRDMDAAANDVRDRVSRSRRALPNEVDEPVIVKAEADAEPVIYLAFSSTRHSPLEISEYAQLYVRDQLQTLPGVSEVRIFGERRYAMRIWLDPARMAAYGITTQDIEAAIRSQNIEVPAGRIESTSREFIVSSATRLQSEAEFRNIALRESGDYLVRLEDIANVQLASENERIIARLNGRPAVALGVIKQSTANPLTVSAAVREALPQIQADLPEGMTVDIANDSSVFIDRSLSAVFQTLAEAILLVVGVVFLFLRSLRATLIPLVTIPVSLIGTAALLYLFGFSINTLTLLAAVLAIGLVVDDAIVVLENIYRHIENGMGTVAAAIKGIQEIGFPVIAMTLTLAAVFTPIAFSQGETGRLFTEFALALAGAVLISGFVALTLSPMMCALLLRMHRQNQAPTDTSRDPSLPQTHSGWVRIYGVLLEHTLRHRLLAVLMFPLVGAIGYWAFSSLPSELVPAEDRASISGRITGPEGATPGYMANALEEVEAIYAMVPEARQYFAVIGGSVSSRAISFLRLIDWEERTRSAAEIIKSLRGPLASIPSIMVGVSSPSTLGQGRGGSGVQIILRSGESYAALQKIADQVLAEAASNPNFSNLESNLELNKPEISLTLARDKAASLGLDPELIGRSLETMLGGRQVTQFQRGAEQYPVILQLESGKGGDPNVINALYVRNRSGEMIPLANLVSIEESASARELSHFDKLRAVTLSANLAEGYSLGAALAYFEEVVPRIAGPRVQLDYSGAARQFKEASQSLIVIFLLALAFIYLVLAAQFESFIDPLIIMLTVPLTLAGALLTLHWAGGTLNLYSQIGLITLIGLITKHGILIVEFANQMRTQGVSSQRAILEAAKLRLRPIAMTTAAMALGAVPLALASGAGAESRQQIGIVIVGGISFGTLLTLFLIPAVYSLIKGERPLLRNWVTDTRMQPGGPPLP